jgi:hypothetical protein
MSMHVGFMAFQSAAVSRYTQACASAKDTASVVVHAACTTFSIYNADLMKLGIQAAEQVQDSASVDHEHGHGPNKELAEAIQAAIQTGTLHLTCCLVKQLPLMPQGELRPVKLPCCGLTVSHAGALQLSERRTCCFCFNSLAAKEFAEDREVAWVVAAERDGLIAPQISPDKITVGREIGRGGEGSVFEATYKGKTVAVKKLFIGRNVRAADTVSMQNVLATAYLAGIANEHVCKLYGFCKTDNELWYDPPPPPPPAIDINALLCSLLQTSTSTPCTYTASIKTAAGC